MTRLKGIVHSVRFRLILFPVLLVFPLILLLLYSNLYALQLVRDQVKQSTKNSIDLYMKQIDENLDVVDNYLFSMAAQNLDLLDFELSAATGGLPYQMARLRLNQVITFDIDNYKMIDMFFVYSQPNHELLTSRVIGASVAARNRFLNQLNALLADHQTISSYNNMEWYPVRWGNDHFLLRIVRTGQVSIGAMVSIERLMRPISSMNLGQGGQAFFATLQGEVMLTPSMSTITSSTDSGVMAFSNQIGEDQEYLFVKQPSNSGDFALVAAIKDSEIVENLPFILRLTATIPYIVIGIMLLYLYLLRKMIVRPVARIVTAMKQIYNGNLEARIPTHAVTREFDLMNWTFNQMAAQIRELKIHLYEEKLSTQRAELKHLQLQINPHFFLNSLNIINSLALTRNYQLISELSISLVQYFRFMFRSNLRFVKLNEEIAHCKNYLNIQELRFPDTLTYACRVDPDTERILVPPLIFQSFIENTVKHAVTLDERIHIDLQVRLTESQGRRFVHMTIKDSGEGFEETILSKLEANESLESEEGEHIGIDNIKRRLHYLYQGEASIRFCNDGGARVDIVLPFREKEECHVPIAHCR